MKKSFWIWLLFPTLTAAQFNDDFNDGDFTNPLWSGDSTLFAVNIGTLQLNAGGSGTASLTYQRTLQSLQEHEWSFKIKLNFSPSSQNYARYFLFCNDINPTIATKALYLQLGETGANDAPVLMYRNNGSITTIARGMDGSIALGGEFVFSLQCDSNYYWSLFSKATGSIQQLQFAIQYTSLTEENFAGWQCTYTSSNASSFYLDDVYDGNLQEDTIAPSIINHQLLSSDSIKLAWDENVNITSANFIINGVSCIANTISGTEAMIVYPQGFTNGNNYQVIAQNIKDLAGNIRMTETINFQYIVPLYPKKGDIILNEIMADPGGANALPAAEYIEIVNVSNTWIRVDSLLLTDGTSICILPLDTIAPGEKRVYASTTAATLLTNQNITARGLTNFPSLNNSGDQVRLMRLDSLCFDQITYSTTTYQHPVKSNGGWSLERIDANYPCEAENNWRASEDPRGGSPGTTNSIAGSYQDFTPPCLLYAEVIDSLTLRLHFSEAMNENDAIQLVNYSVSENTIQMQAAKVVNTTIVELKLSNPVSSNKIYKIEVFAGMRDCAGNPIQNCNSAKLGIGTTPQAGEVIINEILFNPYTNANDFVEIKNISDKIFALDRLRLARNESDGTITSYYPITAEGRALFPGEIIALSTHPEELSALYRCVENRQCLQMEIPSFNDDAGTCYLINAQVEIVDEMSYTDEQQYSLLNTDEGVSLERVSAYSASADPMNWHSAATSCGYASPGRENSQSVEYTPGEDFLEAGSELFSPDNDGEKDLYSIRVHLPVGGYALRMQIFSAEGLPARTICAHDLTGTFSIYFWDGIDENGKLCSPGIYVLVAEAVHPEGDIKRAKIPCTLVKKF